MSVPITGYRQLDAVDVELINSLKHVGVKLGGMVDQLRETPYCDQRWVEIGATDLQTGLMALVRAIAKPTTF